MSIFSSLSDAFSTPGASQKPKTAQNDQIIGSSALNVDNIYKPDPTAWYSAKPYGFKLTKKDGTSFIMFMPITPSNINVSTNFATNIIPTLYGTVEEHSDVRYYDIVIEGTTGMAPKFVSPSGGVDSTSKAAAANGDPNTAYGALQQPGRASFKIASSAALGGLFSSTIANAANILNQAQKAMSTISGLFGGNTTAPETGLYVNQTGYMAFHNLYRFLLAYKKDAAGVESDQQRQSHPLTFFNYKDGVEYDVAVRNFTLKRSAENPMLYYYSITMRGYNIRPNGSQIPTEDLKNRLEDLGLAGVNSSSLLSSIKSVSSNAKAILGSAVNGVNLFGR
jgi:hypothetical protein